MFHNNIHVQYCNFVILLRFKIDPQSIKYLNVK